MHFWAKITNNWPLWSVFTRKWPVIERKLGRAARAGFITQPTPVQPFERFFRQLLTFNRRRNRLNQTKVYFFFLINSPNFVFCLLYFILTRRQSWSAQPSCTTKSRTAASATGFDWKKNPVSGRWANRWSRRWRRTSEWERKPSSETWTVW